MDGEDTGSIIEEGSEGEVEETGVEGTETSAEAVPAAAAAAPAAKKEKPRNIGFVAREAILAGKDNTAALAAVMAEFPTCNASMATMNWYRNDLRKAGHEVPTSRALQPPKPPKADKTKTKVEDVGDAARRAAGDNHNGRRETVAQAANAAAAEGAITEPEGDFLGYPCGLEGSLCGRCGDAHRPQSFSGCAIMTA